MSALAAELLARGHAVSGSDSTPAALSAVLPALITAGLALSPAQTAAALEARLADLQAQHLPPPIVVYSSAIPAAHAERRAAAARELLVLHRSQLLAALLESPDCRSIAVAGSHGKTTTSACVATLLLRAGADPTALIGGLVPALNHSNHRHGGRPIQPDEPHQGPAMSSPTSSKPSPPIPASSDLEGTAPPAPATTPAPTNPAWLVAETDESDGTLSCYRPTIGLLTNLDYDHVDHYPTPGHTAAVAAAFAANCQSVFLANSDCQDLTPAVLASLASSSSSSSSLPAIRTFGTTPAAFYSLIPTPTNPTLAVWSEDGCELGTVAVPLPGRHNLSNTAAALAACREAGVPFSTLAPLVTTLQLPSRRFAVRPDPVAGRILVDDYAHHPAEIIATLTTARAMLGAPDAPLPAMAERLVVVFQPHRFSRTAAFLDAFAQALTSISSSSSPSPLPVPPIFLAPVHPAGEEPIPDADSAALATRINQLPSQCIRAVAFPSLPDLAQALAAATRPGDLILLMGAGPLPRLGALLEGLLRPPPLPFNTPGDLFIQGPSTLRGVVHVPASKNASLPLLIAAMLSSEPQTFVNLPNITDVHTLLALLAQHGASISLPDSADAPHTVCASLCDLVPALPHDACAGCPHPTPRPTPTPAPASLGSQLRASVLLLAVLLGRTGRACLPLPGGCAIGQRPVDMHLAVLSAMGADVELRGGHIHATLPAQSRRRLTGASIVLPQRSVGASECALLAGVLAAGETRVSNAAVEPEVTALAHALLRMGADIRGLGTPELQIRGVASLHGATHRLSPDRIVAGTFALAAVATRGAVELRPAPVAEMDSVLEILRDLGAQVSSPAPDVLCVAGPPPGTPLHPLPLVETGPYPAFPSDLQAPLTAVLALADGESRVHECVMPGRTTHAAALAAMGACISVEPACTSAPTTLIIRGPAALVACDSAPPTDLRTSASLVLAALAAAGVSRLCRPHHLHRGYQDIVQMLQDCGATIWSER